MGLRKRFRDFRDWCPQPPDSVSVKLKRYSVPMAAVLTVSLVLSASFFVFSTNMTPHAVPLAPLVTIPSSPSTNSSWPMFRSDASHSGAGTGEAALNVSLLWKFKTGGEVDASPAVVDGVVYDASFDGNMYAINASDGAKIWNTTLGAALNGTGEMAFSSPAVADGLIYIGGADGNIDALNASSGVQIWNTTLHTFYGSSGQYSFPVDPSPNILNGMLYIDGGSEGGLSYVYAYNASSGRQLWSSLPGAGSAGYIYSSPAVSGGIVYTGTALFGPDPNIFNGVFAFNDSSGKQLWQNTYPSNTFTSSPTVADGMVYAGAWDGNVYALNGTTGVKLWNYATAAPVESSPAVMDRVLYVGSSDGYIYALGASQQTSTQPNQHSTMALYITASVAIGAAAISAGALIVFRRVSKFKKPAEAD